MTTHPLFWPTFAFLLGCAVTVYCCALNRHRGSRERTACYRCDVELPEAGLCAECKRKRALEEAEYMAAIEESRKREWERNARI